MEATDLVKQATNPLIGEVTQFDLEIENATESSTGSDVVNVAEGGLSFGPIDIAEEDETVEFSVPEEGSLQVDLTAGETGPIDRKSTRLNSSHVAISYAVFCLTKKN